MYSLTDDRRCPICGEKLCFTDDLLYDYFCPECNITFQPWECANSMGTLAEDMRIQEELDKNL